MKSSLYFHFPFCRKKCAYCDFFSVETGSLAPPEAARLLDAEITELEERLEKYGITSVPSVFIGGGTPSVADADLMFSFAERIMKLTDGLRTPDFEFTTEANPESCSPEFMEASMNAGINRLSLGIQSFDTGRLAAMGRACIPENITETAMEIASFWRGQLSIDLITGTDSGYVSDIIKASVFPAGHLSVYALTPEEGTPLMNDIRSGFKPEPDNDLQAEAMNNADSILSEAGFIRYEVSNYCRPGLECKHNLGYWNMQSYIGIGPAAVSGIYGSVPERIYNPADLRLYLNKPGRGSRSEALNRKQFMLEHFIAGMRLYTGMNCSVFRESFGMEPEESAPGVFSRWRKAGLMQDGRTALNRMGMMRLDAFLAEIFDEIY